MMTGNVGIIAEMLFVFYLVKQTGAILEEGSMALLIEVADRLLQQEVKNVMCLFMCCFSFVF
jgi:hypothetical protein